MTKYIQKTSQAAFAALWLFALGACSAAGDHSPAGGDDSPDYGEQAGEIEEPLVSNCASGKLGPAISASAACM